VNPGLSACFILFAGTAALSAAITGLAVFVARRLQLLAHPVARSSHAVPTPQVGGVGICIALGVALVAVPALARRMGEAPTPAPFAPDYYDSRWAVIAVLALGLALGLLDDILHMAAVPKLMGQIVLAAAPLLLGISFAYAAFPGTEPYRTTGLAPSVRLGIWIGGALAFLWILFFLNAFNFMDGVNGQSGFFALNALFWWAVIWLMRASESGIRQELVLREVFLPLSAAAGAVLGFLFWNFPRARTFMGDSGSLPLGAALATMAVAASIFHLDVFVAFCFPLALFIYDVLYTLAWRASRGENLLTAHRSHLYQRLLIATGWSHARLLAFHLPFYLFSGLAGAVYFSSLAGYQWACHNPRAGLCRWIPPEGIRIACLVFLALLLLAYTLLVWRFEKGRKEAHAS